MSTFGADPSCTAGDLVAELTSGRFPMFSTLVKLVAYAGLVEVLSDTPDITVLCPTNDAFTRAGITAPGKKVMKNGVPLSKQAVATLLKDHVFGGWVRQLRQHERLTNLNGNKVDIATDENLRTMVMKGDSSACVLMQGFTSSNAVFAALGRVLYEEDAALMGARHLSASFVAHEGHPH